MSTTRTATRGLVKLLLLLFAFFSLSACGGGGGGTTVAGGGIGGTGLTAGSITGFGSVIVNGVEFKTDVTTVRKRLDDGPDNIPGADNAVFRTGMVVQVRHNPGDNTNTALEIKFQDDIEGPVASLDNVNRTFTVLGQAVGFDNATSFFLEPGAVFSDNATVEVSGFPDNAGAVRAAFIKVEAVPKPVFEIKGFVGNLTPTTFTLGRTPGTGTVAVDYSSATLKDLPAGLSSGLFVEVKTLSASVPLAATSVEGKGSVRDDVSAAGAASIEGIVTGLAGAEPAFTFTLNGVTVATSETTTGRASVFPNAHIQAEGSISGGALQAAKISPRL